MHNQVWPPHKERAGYDEEIWWERFCPFKRYITNWMIDLVAAWLIGWLLTELELHHVGAPLFQPDAVVELLTTVGEHKRMST